MTTAVRTRRLRAAPGVAALAALALTACASEEDPAEFEDPEAASQTQEETSGGLPENTGEPEAADETSGAGEDSAGAALNESEEADSGGEVDEEPAEDPTDETASGEGRPVNPDDAVETITYALPTDSINGTMTVGLHHLRTNGETMELLLTYTPEFDEHEQYSLWDLHGKDHSQVPPSLYDRENLKSYSLLRADSSWNVQSVWATEQTTVDLASGDSQPYWANFPAPEDDIDTLNVGIPNAPEFEDVEIQGDSDEQSPGGDGNGEDE